MSLIQNQSVYANSNGDWLKNRRIYTLFRRYLTASFVILVLYGPCIVGLSILCVHTLMAEQDRCVRTTTVVSTGKICATMQVPGVPR